MQQGGPQYAQLALSQQGLTVQAAVTTSAAKGHVPRHPDGLYHMVFQLPSPCPAILMAYTTRCSPDFPLRAPPSR